MKGKKIDFQTLFNIFVVITISVLLYFHFRKKESFEGIAGSSFVSRVPKGTIVAFNGTVAPAGWALCNGKNGTPDLKSKFILGYESGANNIGDTAGEKEVTLTPDQIPLHTHGVERTCLGGGAIGWDTDERLVSSGARENCKTNNGKRKLTEGAGGQQDGYTKPHNNMPPYYVLAYIIKL